MTATCINLRECFGDLYRITRDPSADSLADPWLHQIPCERGVIYPHGGDVLAVDVDHRTPTAKKLAALGLTQHHDGNHEKTFHFSVERFDEVAAIVLPRKRRKLSPEQREACAARLSAYKFPARQGDGSSALRAEGREAG